LLEGDRWIFESTATKCGKEKREQGWNENCGRDIQIIINPLRLL